MCKTPMVHGKYALKLILHLDVFIKSYKNAMNWWKGKWAIIKIGRFSFYLFMYLDDM